MWFTKCVEHPPVVAMMVLSACQAYLSSFPSALQLLLPPAEKTYLGLCPPVLLWGLTGCP